MSNTRLVPNLLKAVLTLICLLSSSIPVSPEEVSAPDVTYEELQKLDADCHTLDNCKTPRQEDRLDRYNCNCGRFCTRLDTCCVDSPHRTASKPSSNDAAVCSKVYGDKRLQVLMINKCKPNWRGDPSIEKLCLEDGEHNSDPMCLLPVTTSRSKTYKNYFCMRCNEERNRSFRFWNIRFKSDANEDLKFSMADMKYSHSNNMWVVKDKRSGKLVDIVISMEIPKNMARSVSTCRRDVISNCSSSWKDEVVRQKCSAYMGIVMFNKDEVTVQYRNAHCAICNDEDIAQMVCSDFTLVRTKPFSYSLLLDVNTSEGDLVGEVRRCDEDSIYDPFFEKCRTLTCALPDYSVVNGTCVKP